MNLPGPACVSSGVDRYYCDFDDEDFGGDDGFEELEEEYADDPDDEGWEEEEEHLDEVGVPYIRGSYDDTDPVALFGDSEYFGDNLESQLADEGFHLFEDPGFLESLDRFAPGITDTLQLFERDGVLHAFGFVPLALLTLLRQRYTGLDFGNLHVSVPLKGEIARPLPLPAVFAKVPVRPEVDLREYCGPVGDQLDTARCAAFAWTHAAELVRRLDGLPLQRLSPNYAMLQFQRMQGDARDYAYAFEGGSGTISGPEPGEVVVEHGACRQELWPDPEEHPRAPERHLDTDAGNFRLRGTPHPLALEDLRRALSAGCPVQLGMNTGPAFSHIGRDGILSVAEAPSGRHGRHAMLLVGHRGHYYIAKNSWGSHWGDRGYCYLPEAVLAVSQPELIAVLR